MASTVAGERAAIASAVVRRTSGRRRYCASSALRRARAPCRRCLRRILPLSPLYRGRAIDAVTRSEPESAGIGAQSSIEPGDPLSAGRRAPPLPCGDAVDASRRRSFRAPWDSCSLDISPVAVTARWEHEQVTRHEGAAGETRHRRRSYWRPHSKKKSCVQQDRSVMDRSNASFHPVPSR